MPAGERFGQALNALLASSAHRHTGVRVTYVFWSRSGPVPMFAFAPPPEADDLAALLAALQWSAQGRANGDRADDPRANEFHLFGLTANAARVVVRSALDTTLGEIGARQAAWFTRLSLIGAGREAGRGTVAEGAGCGGLPRVQRRRARVGRRAGSGGPGRDAASGVAPEGVVMRCRQDMDGRVTYPRAALLKYVLTQASPPETANALIQEVTASDHGEVMASDVFGAGVPAVRPAAYHCGRLLVELEDVQKAAMPGSMIGALFFGAARPRHAGRSGDSWRPRAATLPGLIPGSGDAGWRRGGWRRSGAGRGVSRDLAAAGPGAVLPGLLSPPGREAQGHRRPDRCQTREAAWSSWAA